MNYAFTDRVRKLLARAVEEAHALGHDYVGTEHMLLAVACAGGVAEEVLRQARIGEAEVRADVGGAVRRGRAFARGKSEKGLPYTSRGKKVLEYAMAESRELGHKWIGTEHILLGLLREEKGIAAQILRARGLELNAARWRVRAVLDDDPGGVARTVLGEATPEATRRDRFTFAIDDASSSSIYEQIVAQVQEAVATGRLGAGERLPSVRRLADELDIAPGTVARAYGELERLGVVRTDGARGTRIAEAARSQPAEDERAETLVGLIRPVVVAAFHLGATAADLRGALASAMRGIFDEPDGGGREDAA